MTINDLIENESYNELLQQLSDAIKNRGLTSPDFTTVEKNNKIKSEDVSNNFALFNMQVKLRYSVNGEPFPETELPISGTKVYRNFIERIRQIRDDFALNYACADCFGQCYGNCSGSCNGRCSGQCTSDCGAYCEGNCSSSIIQRVIGGCLFLGFPICSISAPGGAILICPGQCQVNCSGGCSKNNCTGGCTTGCSGHCSGSSCYHNCFNTCSLSCVENCSDMARIGGGDF